MSRELAAIVVGALLASGAVAAPVVVVDEGHGQRFVVGREGELDLSTLGSLIASRDVAIEVSSDPLGSEILQSARGLVISGAFAPLAESEIDAVIRFLEGGGRLAVMLHIGPPVAALLDRLGVFISNGVIRESDGVLSGDPINFRVHAPGTHPLLAGIDGFAIFGGWALLPSAEGVSALASTGHHAWIDLNRSGRYDAGDAMQRFAVAVVGRRGDGEFVVFADDAMFQNSFLGTVEENRRLAENLGAWLRGESASGTVAALLRGRRERVASPSGADSPRVDASTR